MTDDELRVKSWAIPSEIRVGGTNLPIPAEVQRTFESRRQALLKVLWGIIEEYGTRSTPKQFYQAAKEMFPQLSWKIEESWPNYTLIAKHTDLDWKFNAETTGSVTHEITLLNLARHYQEQPTLWH